MGWTPPLTRIGIDVPRRKCRQLPERGGRLCITAISPVVLNSGGSHRDRRRHARGAQRGAEHGELTQTPQQQRAQRQIHHR